MGLTYFKYVYANSEIASAPYEHHYPNQILEKMSCHTVPGTACAGMTRRNSAKTNNFC